jgi:hypothetical protein
MTVNGTDGTIHTDEETGFVVQGSIGDRVAAPLQSLSADDADSADIRDG